MMAKKKELDKLSLDMIECEKTGFGVHYGKWKAMQPPVKIPRLDPFANLPEKKKTSICQWCGKTFIQSRNGKQIYCELYCQRMANYERKRLRILERRAQGAK